MLLIAGWTVYPIVCGWALWRGGTTLRIAAGLALLSTGLGLAFPLPEQILFPIDVALMLAMMALSLKSRRLWTLPAGALMIDRAAIHAFPDIEPAGTMGYICAFGLLLCLAAGLLAQDSRRVRIKSPAQANS